jgi:hypothetical protein
VADLELTVGQAREQFRALASRRPAHGGRQVAFLPAETLLCLAASFLVNHRHFGGSTAHQAPEPVPSLARLFSRPPRVAGRGAGRWDGDLSRVRRLGVARFTAAVRRELSRWGGRRPCLRIIRAVFAALAGPAGVTAHRPGALERAHLALGGWRDTRTPARRCRDPDVHGPGRARAGRAGHHDRPG